jgi:ATP-dependent DNA helicase RecG
VKNKEPSLSSPLTVLRGVGPALSKTLERLDLHRVEDLLFLLPSRYEDRSKLHPIGTLRPGMRCLISGAVLRAETVYRGRRSLLVGIGDDSGQITLRFFHFSRQQQAQFRNGVIVTCFGDVRPGGTGLEIVHPEYRLLSAGQKPAVTDSLTPIYPMTGGIQQGRLRNLVAQALNIMQSSAPAELLPPEILQELDLPPLSAALDYLHNPPTDVDLASIEAGKHPCQVRLSFEELLAHYMSLRNLRLLAKHEAALALQDSTGKCRQFIAQLPYTLTAAQVRVVAEIDADLRTAHPMMRLIQGDVGSGKTVVAAAACVQAASSGVQAAIMAPTELLAEQHWTSFSQWFREFDIELAWLSGSQKQAERRASLEAIRSGSAGIVIGTHALFQEGVEFAALALVVIDEQHRFGVHQRVALRNKGRGGHMHPHQLVMTATPIPRTLAMAAYADLDTSVIDELPPGRRPATTIALPDTRRVEVVERVRQACSSGQQAYWVCPLIDESELLDYQAAEASHKMLTEYLGSLRVGLVHGRMKNTARDEVMRAFKNGDIDVLVATTVIEVGVDVPNATLMIVENSERMGLSQLHQLRGRVGRGAAQSHCVMLYKQPLGRLARNRLAVLRKTNDGFIVAQRDLELRGPGELLGTKQTGLPEYRIADLVRDADLMPAVQTSAEIIRLHHRQAGQTIVRRWLGDAHQYGKV